MKKSLAIIGIGAAFLAVSLWVWLSQGRNAKAVRAKFRLGGTLLALTGMMSLGSCESLGMVDCYDPAPQNEIWVSDGDLEIQDGVIEVRNGDQLSICAQYLTTDEIIVAINDSGAMEIQREVFKAEQSVNEYLFTVDVADYVGEAELIVYLGGDGNEIPCYAAPLNVVE